MSERSEGVSPRILHDLVARAQKATAGRWRPVGKRVASGENLVFEAMVPRRGLPGEARANAEFVAAANPSAITAIVNEIFRMRREVADARRQVEEAEAQVEAMRQEMARARAVAAAVTLPTTAQAAETAGRLAARIKRQAPGVARLVDSLAKIARARAEVDDEGRGF